MRAVRATGNEPLRGTLTASLEEALRRDIVAGLLEPEQRLRMADVSERYGVSATPVREALQRLAEQGFVALDPQIGARVAKVSEDDVVDVYAVRLILEREALVRSLRNGGVNWRTELEVRWAELRGQMLPDIRADSAAWSSAHREFHWALLAACDSPWLLRFLRTLYDHSGRYALLSRVGGNAHRDWPGEHQSMFEAAAAGDVGTASTRLVDHLTTSVRLLVGENGTDRLRSLLADGQPVPNGGIEPSMS